MVPERLYVLGHPVAHSKSPAMHNAAYRALGLNWEYGFADRETETSARVFLNVRNWRAVNVTMPWKPLAFEFSSERSAAASLAQGANVLVNWGKRVYADNTDGKGCVAYLQRCGVDFADARVVVCGTGPTSLAILHACAEAGASRIALLGRDSGKAQRVLDDYHARVDEVARKAPGAADMAGAASLSAAAGATEFSAGAYEANQSALEQATLIIDATSLGMHPDDPAPFNVDVLLPSQVVFDVVYGHGETALIAAAREKGCAAFDGAGMLVAQAVETVRDIASITNVFSIPAHMDLFAIMAQAAGFDL